MWWRSRSSTLSSSSIAELLTLSLRECPATLRRKLISATCIRDLVLSVMTQKFMAIGEGRNVDLAVNRELRFSAQLSLHHNGPAQCPHYCGSRTIRLSISRSILPTLVNKTPRYLNSSTRGRNYPQT
ncbi:hypothetical protein AMECASPLE_038409 [Ameca splendens]|uniref:Uncharacterized protein n=1 Tax=Ameca splendens TaxID=208324 RepID=A0ABV0ZV57_9TELE